MRSFYPLDRAWGPITPGTPAAAMKAALCNGAALGEASAADGPAFVRLVRPAG